MLETWRILNNVGPETQETIRSVIRLRIEAHRTGGMDFLTARRTASEEVFKEVRRLFQTGGAESVSKYFGHPS
jgi:hypothetical protein